MNHEECELIDITSKLDHNMCNLQVALNKQKCILDETIRHYTCYTLESIEDFAIWMEANYETIQQEVDIVHDYLHEAIRLAGDVQICSDAIFDAARR